MKTGLKTENIGLKGGLYNSVTLLKNSVNY